MPKGTSYSGEFKQKVIEAMCEENLSFEETRKRYGIRGHHAVQDWERTYFIEGTADLYVDHRGRKS